MSYKEMMEHLLDLADPEIAAHSQRFFKTGEGEYGHGDIFLGIRVPVVRQAAKRYRSASLSLVERLLRSKYHEVRLFALLLMVDRFSRAGAGEQEKIYRLYLNNTRHINNWDLVDLSAYHIVGAWLEERDKAVLRRLAKSRSIWERRIAIISTYWFIKRDRYDETMEISEILIGDVEDLIHKAVGWMLREVGKRDIATERKFLKKHYRKMPRTMLRYAIEKFDEEERQRYLKGEIRINYGKYCFDRRRLK
ncbi:MAG: DNA alkylation repair protein [Candidatus Krumholzibacteriota bacterium]|nr:DNA alkylation repair protein [Candidatus Krumholzibacteriota bacterium]